MALRIYRNYDALLIVSYGIPSLPIKKVPKDRLRTKLEELFKSISEEEIDSLWQLIQSITKQKHGTMLVISGDAQQEAIRLKNQSTLIKPLHLTPETILPISSIDGAILLDSQGTCYAIGVILDGIATEHGDPSRGARYNSAIRYSDHMKNRNVPCLIVVISEDGMVNLMSSV